MKYTKIISVILGAVLATAIFTGCDKKESGNNAENVNNTSSGVRVTPTYGEFLSYRYSTLKEDADIIAHVKITDELTQENSKTFGSKYGGIYDYISYRQADVIKMYKNNTGTDFGDSMQVYESAAITSDGNMLIDSGDTPLQKDDEYIVFLKATSDNRGYCIMSGPTGKINLTNPQQNKNGEIEIKFLLDYEAKEPNELIEKILPLEPIAEMVDFTEYEYTTIPTNYGNIEVVQAKLQGDKLHFELHFGEHSITLANFKLI